MASWMFDALPVSILAGASHSGQRLYQHAIEDSSVIFTEYPEKRQAIFITGPDHHQRGEMVFIRGSEGLIAINENSTEKLRVWNQVAGYREIDPSSAEPQWMHAMVLDLISAMESGTTMQCDASRSAVSTRTAFAAHQSARLMKRIDASFTTVYAPLEIVQHPGLPWIPAGRIVLYADEHFGGGGRDMILEALEGTTGRKPNLVEASAGLTLSDLADAAVLLLYHPRGTVPGDPGHAHPLDRIRQANRLGPRRSRRLQKLDAIPPVGRKNLDLGRAIRPPPRGYPPCRNRPTLSGMERGLAAE